ncbi:efflux RND transporter periplasmic adaptor subunit [Denitratisoma oestradiolicum]|uniref:RND transporter n=1 Tax=Denitratisoma oestradiolicum TaxID=311182 RepID=A0A6S6Y160_9PROT|nr:efflux RND transporter periplasmic adaptor subunit [Denitratisoma oestradiolicum]TWO79127.1 hypothetical protein CBW56_16475 [Denitratisoma oestradiolicum]CAB1371043.1 RND transporter [Denitratisoma oestradiolicum]
MKKAPFLIAIVLLAVGAYWFTRQPSSAQSPTPQAVPVVTVVASSNELPVVLDLTGRTEAEETVTLRARVEGQVLAVPFTEGQHVKKGEALIHLDPADYAARLRQVEALAQKARLDARRYEELKDKGFVSAEKLADVRASAEAQAAAAELARLQLSYTTIRAPFDGIIGARLVFPGTAVKANDTALAVVNRVRPLKVSFTVAEKHLPALQTALSKGSLTATITAPGGAAWEGPVRFLDNGVDRATGTIQLKATLSNTQETLLPGQFVQVRLVLDILRGAVTLPAQAIQQGPEGSYVYVVKADQHVELRPVEVAAQYQGQVAIAKGITAGDTVVSEGQLRLTPGALAQVKKPAPAAGQ